MPLLFLFSLSLSLPLSLTPQVRPRKRSPDRLLRPNHGRRGLDADVARETRGRHQPVHRRGAADRPKPLRGAAAARQQRVFVGLHGTLTTTRRRKEAIY